MGLKKLGLASLFAIPNFTSWMCVTVADFESTKIPLQHIRDLTTFFHSRMLRRFEKKNCLNYPKLENIWTTKSKLSNIKKSLLFFFIFLNFLINQSKITQRGGNPTQRRIKLIGRNHVSFCELWFWWLAKKLTPTSTTLNLTPTSTTLNLTPTSVVVVK